MEYPIFLILLQLVIGNLLHEANRSCTRTEIIKQYQEISLVQPDICDHLLPWTFAQIHIPDAKVFIDGGANLGYISALMFGLWSPGYEINRKTLLAAILADKNPSNNAENGTNTYCLDGGKIDFPVNCPNRVGQICPTKNNITVYSIDGELSLVNNQNNTIHKHFHVIHQATTQSSKNQLKWEYIHSAIVGNRSGNFEYGYFQQLANGGSKFLGMDKKKLSLLSKYKNAILVPITSIDKFCEKRQLDQVDVIKLDIEGQEFGALRGARYTLTNRGVKFLSYECNSHICNDRNHIIILTYLHRLGFICYMGGKSSFLLKLTGCINAELSKDQQGRHIELKGNVYCGHLQRTPEFVEALQQKTLFHRNSNIM